MGHFFTGVFSSFSFAPGTDAGTDLISFPVAVVVVVVVADFAVVETVLFFIGVDVISAGIAAAITASFSVLPMGGSDFVVVVAVSVGDAEDGSSCSLIFILGASLDVSMSASLITACLCCVAKPWPSAKAHRSRAFSSAQNTLELGIHFFSNRILLSPGNNRLFSTTLIAWRSRPSCCYTRYSPM